MNTKYIKVSVKERMPDKGWVLIKYKTEKLPVQRLYIPQYDQKLKDVTEYWLEEIPDREDELKEILKTYIEEFKAFNFSAETLKRAEQILKELK